VGRKSLQNTEFKLKWKIMLKYGIAHLWLQKLTPYQLELEQKKLF